MNRIKRKSFWTTRLLLRINSCQLANRNTINKKAKNKSRKTKKKCWKTKRKSKRTIFLKNVLTIYNPKSKTKINNRRMK